MHSQIAYVNELCPPTPTRGGANRSTCLSRDTYVSRGELCGRLGRWSARCVPPPPGLKCGCYRGGIDRRGLMGLHFCWCGLTKSPISQLPRLYEGTSILATSPRLFIKPPPWLLPLCSCRWKLTACIARPLVSWQQKLRLLISCSSFVNY